MKKILLFTLFSLAVINVSGCDQKLTYSYLIEHPLITAKEAERCQTDEHVDKVKCIDIMKAYDTLQTFENEHISDPELFGQSILNTQTSLIKTKNQLQDNQKKLQQLMQNDGNTIDNQRLKDAINKDQIDYTNLQEKNKAMLSIVGLHKPE